MEFTVLTEYETCVLNGTIGKSTDLSKVKTAKCVKPVENLDHYEYRGLGVLSHRYILPSYNEPPKWERTPNNKIVLNGRSELAVKECQARGNTIKVYWNARKLYHARVINVSGRVVGSGLAQEGNIAILKAIAASIA
jgi:hypothetical protein